MKIQKDDKVKIITGKDKGKIGKVLKVYAEKNAVLVEGINMVKRHIKPGVADKEGGIISMEKPINVSNVMYVDGKKDNPTRLGYKIVDGKKYRFSKKSKDVIGA